MRPHRSRVSFVLVLTLALTAAKADTEIFVSPSGTDSAPGSRGAPVATLPRAAELARGAVAGNPKGPVTVWLGDGTYLLAHGLVLGEADSGKADAPVTYRAMAGAHPILRLGRLLPSAAIRPLTDAARLARVDPAARGSIREIALKELGAAEVRRLPDVFRGNAGLPELFQLGLPLPLSRWPNGEHGYATMPEVLFGGGQKNGRETGGTFRYHGNRPERWRQALGEGNLWLAGFWRVPWICEAIRVAGLDASAQTLSFARPIPLGIGSKYSAQVLPDGTRRGDGTEKWFALNLLEEIDQPGEWCVDFSRQVIYLWPAADPARHPLFLADIREPLISVRGARHIRLIGLTLDGGADDGIRIEGGENVSVAGCTITNFSRRGVAILDGRDHEVRSCELSQLGLNAVSLRGGDRFSLASCGHRIINNEIHHAGRLEPTAAVILGQGESMIGGGVGVNCVGVVFAHNRIHHCPNAGVYYAGNDNLIEFNEVFRIGLNSGDLGGFYSSGGWTSRGNVVRHNFVHHSPSANAYYLDDGDSGDLVTGNLAYRTMRGALLGGGHDNVFRGNLFMDCSKGGITVDARGVARGYDMQDHRLGDDFRTIHHDQSPWKDRYPKLARLLKLDPRIPSDVIIEGNIFVSSPLAFPAKPEERAGITVRENLETSENPGLIDPAKLDFRFKPGAGAFTRLPGFAAIPVDKIGLYADEYRHELPAGSLSLVTNETSPDEPGFDSAKDIEASNRRRP